MKKHLNLALKSAVESGETQKNRSEMLKIYIPDNSLWFFRDGYISDPFKWLSDLQLGDEKVTAWITWFRYTPSRCFFVFFVLFKMWGWKALVKLKMKRFSCWRTRSRVGNHFNSTVPPNQVLCLMSSRLGHLNAGKSLIVLNVALEILTFDQESILNIKMPPFYSSNF